MLKAQDIKPQIISLLTFPLCKGGWFAKIQKPRINQFRIRQTQTLSTDAERSTNTKKSRIRETKHLSTDVDRRVDQEYPKTQFF
jgi:hypothetical protein